MWFDENEKNTCITCKYGDKESSSRHCRQCISRYCLSGMGFTQWEREERGNYHDIFIQWHTWFWKVPAYIKGNLLDIEKRISSACKLSR